MAIREPFGPITTNSDYYFPPEYYSLAQPPYPTSATHRIVDNYDAGLVGLYTGFATVATKKAAQADLNKKGEWVDSLGPGTEIIVFREACGYKGQWSEVVVVGNKYHTDAQVGPNTIEKKKLYLRNDALRSLTIQSHPIVNEDDIVSPTDAIIPSNWRNMVLEKPFLDNRLAAYSVVVEYRIDNPDSVSDVIEFMQKSLEKGTDILFDYYNKRGPSDGSYFIFARATEYHIEARPADYNSSIKVLVQIPQIYFDTYEARGPSVGSQISQGLSDAEDFTNRFLDSNNGAINTQVARELAFSGLDEDALRSEARVENIFGADVEFVQEDWARELAINPEASAARSQQAIDDLGDALNSLPEHLYNRFIPGEWRDSIEGAISDVRDAYAAAGEFSDDVTQGLQDVLDTLNTVTSALENAPDFASVNDSLVSALGDPNVDLSNLTSEAIGGALVDANNRRRAEERDITDVLPKLEGTLLYQRYLDLDFILKDYEFLESSYRSTAIGNTADMLIADDYVRKIQIAENDLALLVEQMKRVEFYSSFLPEELNSGLVNLSVVLRNYEKEKDAFQGDVTGWRPKYDADRVDLILPKIDEYLIGYTERNDLNYEKDNLLDIQFAFSRNHKLIYIGIAFDDFAEQRTLHFYGDSSLGAHVRGTPPLDSETIMAYLWKLNDSTKEGNLKLTQWGSKYVFPRPTFVYKPRLTSDVTQEIKRLDEEILTLKKVGEQRNGFQDTKLRLRQGAQAINHVEQTVDSYAAGLNDKVDAINDADDVFFDWLAAASSEMNPYVAGLIKCVTPKIDIDLLPEIPDIDLSILRNPVMKFIELTDAILPSDPNWQLEAAAQKAWEQAKKLLWVTAVKMVLEYYAAACLQLQAFAIGEALDAIDGLINPDPDNVNLDLAGGAQTQQALEDSALLNSFRDSKLLPLDGLSNSESIDKIRALFSDITSLLSPVEVCQLTSALAPTYVVELVKNLIEVKHPYFINVLDSRSKIQDLFISIGDIIDHNLCDEIISNHENETYNASYGGIACDISEEISELRRSILKCQPGLTPEMIEDIIARENENNLRTLRTLLENLGADKTVPPLNIETDATKHAKKMAYKSLFSPADRALNKELKEYGQYMRNVAESNVSPYPTPEALEILHSKVVIEDTENYRFASPSEVMLGTRTKEELPFATEIAKDFRTQLKTIETDEEYEGFIFNTFSTEEANNGFKIKLSSIGQDAEEDESALENVANEVSVWREPVTKEYNNSTEYSSFDAQVEHFINTILPELPAAPAAQKEIMKDWRANGMAVEMNCREYDWNDNQYYQSGYGDLDWFHDNGSWNDPVFNEQARYSSLPSSITEWDDALDWFTEQVRSQSNSFKENVEEEEGGIKIYDMTYRLGISKYEITIEREEGSARFEMTYRLHNMGSEMMGLVSQFASAINSPINNNLESRDKKGNYSITIRDTATQKDKFVFSSNVETSEEVKNYLEQSFPSVTFDSLLGTSASPQQIYFEKFVNTGNDEELADLLKSEIFSQVTKDIIGYLGRRIANSKYFDFSDEEENGSKISNLEALRLEEKSLFNLDATLDAAVDKYIEGKSSDVPPPRDATVQRTNYNAYEVAGLEQSIKSMVRVYVIEYFVKGLFATSSFKTIGEARDVAKDYLLEKIKSDIPKQFNRIFNYKLFYLGRGIYQDNLEVELTGKDHDLDYIFKKHISEQYDIISKQWDKIIREDSNQPSVPEEQPAQMTAAAIPGASMMAQAPLLQQAPSTLSDAAQQYLRALPTRSYLPRRMEISTFWKDDYNILKNGNFYYERYIKIEKSDGTTEIYSPFVFGLLHTDYGTENSTPDYERSYHGIRLKYLFPVDKDLSSTSLEKINFEDSEKTLYALQIAEAERLFTGDWRELMVDSLSLLTDDFAPFVEYMYTPEINNALYNILFAKEELKFLFDYIFPIEKYKTLMNIYTVESMAEFPGLDSMFMETKIELRTAFNKMDSRGRFNYSEPDRERKLGEIQEAKNRQVLPLQLASTSNLAREARPEMVLAPTPVTLEE
jgi:hypothetical protein